MVIVQSQYNHMMLVLFEIHMRLILMNQLVKNKTWQLITHKSMNYNETTYLFYSIYVMQESSCLYIRDCLQILLPILREFKRINQLLSLLQSSGNQRFSNDFRGNRSQLIRLNSVDIRSQIWSRSQKHLFSFSATAILFSKSKLFPVIFSSDSQINPANIRWI